MSKEPNENPIFPRKTLTFFNYQKEVRNLSSKLIMLGFEYRTLSGNNEVPEEIMQLNENQFSLQNSQPVKSPLLNKKSLVVINQKYLINQLKERISTLNNSIKMIHASNTCVKIPILPSEKTSKFANRHLYSENSLRNDLSISCHISGYFPSYKCIEGYLSNQFHYSIHEQQDLLMIDLLAKVHFSPTFTCDIGIIVNHDRNHYVLKRLTNSKIDIQLLFFWLDNFENAKYSYANALHRNHFFHGHINRQYLIGIYYHDDINFSALSLFNELCQKLNFDKTLLCEHSQEGHQKYLRFIQSIAREIHPHHTSATTLDLSNTICDDSKTSTIIEKMLTDQQSQAFNMSDLSTIVLDYCLSLKINVNNIKSLRDFRILHYQKSIVDLLLHLKRLHHQYQELSSAPYHPSDSTRFFFEQLKTTNLINSGHYINTKKCISPRKIILEIQFQINKMSHDINVLLDKHGLILNDEISANSASLETSIKQENGLSMNNGIYTISVCVSGLLLDSTETILSKMQDESSNIPHSLKSVIQDLSYKKIIVKPSIHMNMFFLPEREFYDSLFTSHLNALNIVIFNFDLSSIDSAKSSYSTSVRRLKIYRQFNIKIFCVIGQQPLDPLNDLPIQYFYQFCKEANIQDHIICKPSTSGESILKGFLIRISNKLINFDSLNQSNPDTSEIPIPGRKCTVM